MDVTKARQIVSETISGRRRWGRMFLSTHSQEELLDALVVLDEEVGLAENLVEKDDLTKVKRQLTAAKAREAKLKKKIEKLTAASGGE